MAKKAATIDPSLPFTEIKILGNSYKLCFTFRAMAKAGAWLREQGIQANLLRALPSLDIDNITPVFAAALHVFQPQMTYAEVEALLDYDTVGTIRDCLLLAWIQAVPQRNKGEENPPEAAPEEAESGQSPTAINGQG